MSYYRDNDRERHETSENEEDSESPNSLKALEYPRVAMGCDDGSVRIYAVSDSDEFMHTKSLPRVSGRVLNMTWSTDAKRIYSGSSDGSGTLVGTDSSGSVQFWDCQHETLLQVHSLHKGDVNALATAPNHDRVFSAGSDGKLWSCISYSLL